MGILDEFAPHETAWKLLGMSGGGASVGITTGMKLAGPSVGGVGGYFEIGDPTGRRYSLQFAGVSTAFGAGLAPKLTISYSLQDLVASQLYAGASLKQELSLGALGGYFVAINLTKGTLGASGSVTKPSAIWTMRCGCKARAIWRGPNGSSCPSGSSWPRASRRPRVISPPARSCPSLSKNGASSAAACRAARGGP